MVDKVSDTNYILNKWYSLDNNMITSCRWLVIQRIANTDGTYKNYYERVSFIIISYVAVLDLKIKKSR